jgi:hypothetical protein
MPHSVAFQVVPELVAFQLPEKQELHTKSLRGSPNDPAPKLRIQIGLGWLGRFLLRLSETSKVEAD